MPELRQSRREPQSGLRVDLQEVLGDGALGAAQARTQGAGLMLFVIPGHPHAQGRPRMSVRHGRAHVYEMESDRIYRDFAQHHILAGLKKHNRAKPLYPDGPLCLVVTGIFRPPGRPGSRNSARAWHARRSDSDNLAKAVLDAANRILFKDDAQVARLVVSKIVAAANEQACVEIQAWPLPAEVSSDEAH